MSIGLPVYNGERYLGECLDSLLSQSFPDFELLIFDNASTDATPDICAEYARRDPRVVYHRQRENVGAARNYNDVFQAARGELFKWAAHDDLCEPTYLERCVEAFDAHGPGVTLVYPQTLFVDEANRGIEVYPDRLDLRQPSAVARYRTLLRNLWYCNAVFGMIRRADLATTGLIGPYESSDCVLLAELALRGRFVEVPEVLFRRRMHREMSRQANQNAADIAAWFDPRARGRRTRPHFRLLAEHVRAVVRAPIPVSRRMLCAAEISRTWLPRYWRVMAGEVAPESLRRAFGSGRPISRPESAAAASEPVAGRGDEYSQSVPAVPGRTASEAVQNDAVVLGVARTHAAEGTR